MHCQECGWNESPSSVSADQCPRCGEVGLAHGPSSSSSTRRRRGRSGDQPSRVVKIYTGILCAWALVMPFLVPIIIKISRSYP